jgi:Domain of unknown function (DUF4112)
MYTNMAIDFGIGLIPVVGDMADAWFKCNTRNNIILEKYLREKGKKHPVAPLEQKPKQSGLRRWFGGGQTAAAHETDHVSTTAPVPTMEHEQATVHTGGASAIQPELPPRNSARNVNAFNTRGQTHMRQDLEAQIPDNSNAIHYTRG